ncbi:MAG: hypothetical protein ABFC24_09205 [Methanoregulaceae archaeon]
MKTRQKPGLMLACLAVLIVAATIAITGCLESTPGQVTATNEKRSENPAADPAFTPGATTGPALLKTAQPTPASVASAPVIKFDPLGIRKIGGPLIITGTTSLPAGTDLFWQIRPDTGTPPTGLDMSSRMCIMENNLVTEGKGTLNKVSLTIDTNKLVAGKYVAIAMKMKEDPGSGHIVIGDPAGYMYLSLR